MHPPENGLVYMKFAHRPRHCCTSAEDAVPHCSESRRCALLGRTNGVGPTYAARATEDTG
jgi:hypothetical protein